MAEASLSAPPHRAAGVYEIVCLPTGKRYVGSAVNFERRWKLHRHHLKHGAHHSRHLQSAWNKHGADAFFFRAIVLCDRRDVLLYEQLAIDALDPEFNTAKVAGSCAGIVCSDETRARIAAKLRGNKHTLGYRHRAESIEKLRVKQLGVPSPTKGATRSPEAVAATAAAHRGMRRSEETRRRISEAMTGKKRAPKSAETRAKLSEAMKRRPPNPERVAKMAATKRGSKLTDEHKARIGAASRAAWARRKQIMEKQ